MLVRRRSGGGAREGGVVEGGDEWEWWVYWALSGWVDGG